MTEPLGSVVITSREIYDAVVRLTGRVDVLITQQNETSKDLTDHENRLRTLERARWPLPSAAVLISVASLALALLDRL